jgi:hypothetical protein
MGARMTHDPGIAQSNPDTKERPRSSAAIRMERLRQRRRKRIRCLTIEPREAEIDQFVRRRRLL